MFGHPHNARGIKYFAERIAIIVLDQKQTKI